MSISGRNAPLSPISLGGSEWSVSKYQTTGPDDGPYPPNRGNLASPPNSGGPNGNMSLNGFPTGPRSTGGPSPPASISRSSNGTNIYAGSENGRNSVRSDLNESVLNEHYVALRVYLNTRDPNHKQQPNKARDKLLRLSSVQFYELSTDVYDELIRRQATARAPPTGPSGPPAFLLPEKAFHPKRNQARQRLSSLGPSRFRDLAADVFHELERRFPRFIGSDAPRAGSPMSMRGGPSSRSGTPNNGFPPRDNSRIRRPSDASSMRGPTGDAYGPPPSPGLMTSQGPGPGPGAPNGEYGRPTPKQLNQNNTIVPNKSTMLEEDDDGGADDDGDAFALERVATNRDSKRSDGSGVTSEVSGSRLMESQLTNETKTNKKIIDDYQMQLRELREKLAHMEDSMKKKENEMNTALDGERSRATAVEMEKNEWVNLRSGLENKLAEAQVLNDSMRQELERMREDHEAQTREELERARQDHSAQTQQQLDRMHEDHTTETQSLRDQIADLQQTARSIPPANPVKPSNAGNIDSDLQQENEELRRELHEQQRVTEEVRHEAQEFLREMRMISQQSGSSYERHAELEKTIEHLEHEVHDWRNRYARTKTQLRHMRASSMGVTIEEEAAKLLKEKGLIQDNGRVKDIHVTKFQIAIDELLQKARKDNPERVIEAMKSVVVSVRRISKDIDETPIHDEEVAQQQSKLKAKVSTTANNLITASKNYASSAGISPVSLLDAAASHLTAAIVDLLRYVKIRVTPAEELDDEDDGTVTPVDSSGFFSPRSTSQVSGNQGTLPPPPPFQGLGGVRESADSSAYSPMNSPRHSADPSSHNQPMLKTNGLNGAGFPGNQKAVNGYGAPQQVNQDNELRVSR